MRRALLALVLLAATPAAAQSAVEAAAGELGLFFDPTRGMEIESQELQAEQAEQGGDRIVFRGGVSAVQGATRLTCDWLEARYGAAGGAAERVTARGNVRLVGEQTRIACAELVYDGPACRVTCRGENPPASLERGDDALRGGEIEFDLCTKAVRVRGGAAIRVTPQPVEAAR